MRAETTVDGITFSLGRVLSSVETSEDVRASGGDAEHVRPGAPERTNSPAPQSRTQTMGFPKKGPSIGSDASWSVARHVFCLPLTTP